jgi:hypothetical protein
LKKMQTVREDLPSIEQALRADDNRSVVAADRDRASADGQ